MHPFPFTPSEWNAVAETAARLVEASENDDDRLCEAERAELMLLLAQLRTNYGDHPVLLETMADFTLEPDARVELYQQAIEASEAHGLISYTMRLSLADIHLHDFDDTGGALQQLAACQSEVDLYGDEEERAHWDQLDEQCRQGGSQAQSA